MICGTHNSTDRDSFVDFAKGIAIFLVLWGHSIQYLACGSIDFFEDVAFKTIYSFHMPLFMYLSGYVFYFSCKKRTLQQVLFNRIRNIGIPLLAWGTVEFIITLCRNLYQSLQNGASSFFACLWYTFIGGGWLAQIISNAKNIWFLWAVLLSSVMVGIIYHCLPQRKNAQAFLMFAGIIVMLTVDRYVLPVFVYPYFVAGFLVNEYRINHKKIFRLVSKISIPIWVIMLFVYRKEHYIYISGIFPQSIVSLQAGIEQFKVDLFRWAIGFVGTLAVLEIIRLVFQLIQSSEWKKRCEQLGKCSLQLYLISNYLINRFGARIYEYIVSKAGQNYLVRNIFAYDLIITPIYALGFAVLIMKISEMISKNKRLNFLLFGR